MSEGPIAEVSFLVTGTARSGTTLVQRLCCELPGVWVPEETHFWTEAAAVADAFEWPVRDDDRKAAIAMLLERLAGGGLPADPDEVWRQVWIRRRRVGLWTLFEAVVAALCPPERTVLGEKTPNHMFWWRHLMTAMPGLRLLVVVRDPRVVLRSQRSVAWGEHDPYALAERWLAHQRAAFDARRIFGDRVEIIRYEDVVADPAAARSRMAALLGVPDRPSRLGKRLLSRYPLFPGREDWKAAALGSITTDRAGDLAGVSAVDAAVVEAVCRPLMAEFGYPCGPAAAVPAPSGESLERVLSFRRWHASVEGTEDLPIY